MVIMTHLAQMQLVSLPYPMSLTKNEYMLLCVDSLLFNMHSMLMEIHKSFQMDRFVVKVKDFEQ